MRIPPLTADANAALMRGESQLVGLQHVVRADRLSAGA